MSSRTRFSFHFAIATAAFAVWSAATLAQGLQPVGNPGLSRPGAAAIPIGKPSPSAPAASGAPGSAYAGSQSMLDQPAAQARVQLAGDRLTVTATNASLTEVIRQVAAQTGMQVEGNSHDERVFGVYGPGSPLEVISALLYDSGYNVMMVGSTADGAPRRLLLSARTAAPSSSGNTAVQPGRGDDDEDAEQPQEAPPPQAPPQTINQPAPSAPGAVKTPQQMLEELQRMHLGQPPPQEMPREQN